jgi:beta-lactamase class D
MKAIVAVALLLAWNAAPIPARSCFLLYEVGKGEVRRRPADLCTTRLLPASTFKIPHAVAALDAGVVSGPGELMKYDGAPTTMDAWRHDHTLQTATRSSGTFSASPNASASSASASTSASSSTATPNRRVA